MYLSEIKVENFRIYGSNEKSLNLSFEKNLNLIVGENNSGKTALIDAIRLIIGTKDNDRLWLKEEDFYYDEKTKSRADTLKIECRFDDFKKDEAGAFIEWLGIDEEKTKKLNNGEIVYFLKVKLEATRKDKQESKFDRLISCTITAGSDENGTKLESQVRDWLRATYLKPLRDAEQELSAKRNSRLSQILFAHPDINSDTEQGIKTKGSYL